MESQPHKASYFLLNVASCGCFGRFACSPQDADVRWSTISLSALIKGHLSVSEVLSHLPCCRLRPKYSTY